MAKYHYLYVRSRWINFSKKYLKKNPLCAACKLWDVLTPSTETDHIIAHKGDVGLFYAPIHDPTKAQPLCKSCHSSKTGEERSGRIWNYKDNTIWDPTLREYKKIRIDR